ncbi:MAG TPA: lysophospholipid acyltransferase family protein [bacterium]|nr:lysophospholipid acyltransferase family protein [bacterium]HOL34899.1 lysophospholipid acyltransferase family protein [bacterium]HPP08218.1 lysophospholipid acyltransferase family protein [bacterium]
MRSLSAEYPAGESNRLLWMAAKILGFFIFKLFFHLEVYGKENIPRSGKFVIAANHTSFLDPPLLGYICPKPIAYFTKQEQLVGLFGMLITRLGAIPLSKSSMGKSDVRMALNVIKKGKGLLIFPEGTRSRTGQFLPARPGIGFIVLRAEVPVVPVYIKGSFRAMPPGRNFIRPGKIVIRVGEQVVYNRQQTYEEVAQDVMKKIVELSKWQEKS